MSIPQWEWIVRIERDQRLSNAIGKITPPLYDIFSNIYRYFGKYFITYYWFKQYICHMRFDFSQWRYTPKKCMLWGWLRVHCTISKRYVYRGGNCYHLRKRCGIFLPKCGKTRFFLLRGQPHTHTKHIVQAHYTWKIGFEVMTWSHRSSNDGTRRPKNLLGDHSSFLWKKLPGRGHVVIIWVSDLKKAVSSFVYVWAANFEYYSLTA